MQGTSFFFKQKREGLEEDEVQPAEEEEEEGGRRRDPGRLQLSRGASLKPDESEGCSPVSGGRTIRLWYSWPSDDRSSPLPSPVDTGAGGRGGVR